MNKKEYCRGIVDFVLGMKKMLDEMSQMAADSMRENSGVVPPIEILRIMEERARDTIAEKLADLIFPEPEGEEDEEDEEAS